MRVRWTRIALGQLDEIQQFIAQDSPLAAYRVAVELTERPVRLLGENPLLGRIGRARGTRELVFTDLPYILVYRVTDSVEVLALVHAARQWPDRFD